MNCRGPCPFVNTNYLSYRELEKDIEKKNLNAVSVVQLSGHTRGKSARHTQKKINNNNVCLNKSPVKFKGI